MKSKSNTMKTRGESFCSLNHKIMMGGISLTVFLAAFLLLNWCCSYYLMQKQQHLLTIQQQYSDLVYGLQETDSLLYSYAKSGSNDTAQQCRMIINQVKEASESLASLLDNSIFTDQEFMVQSYIERCETLLDEKGTTGQLLTLYQEASEHLALFQSLLETYNEEINFQRESGQLEINTLQNVLRYVTFFGCLLFVLACFVAIREFSVKLTRRIENFTMQAENVSKGDWNVEFEKPAYVRDEVDLLVESFQRMLAVIQNQIEQLKRQEKIERELKETEIKAANVQLCLERAQLRILQSRVNPHFLFNTLNVIAGQAAQENADITMDMIMSTADYLRYSLNKLDKTVTLREEMQNVENYFQIQSRRFGKRILFQLSMDEECADVRIPSMIIQPLCENALLHGVMPLNQGGEIAVSAVYKMTFPDHEFFRNELSEKEPSENVLWKEERIENKIYAGEPSPCVLLSVSDNGVGFEPMRLEEIWLRLSHMDSDDVDDTNEIGLSNVIQRMYAFFHESFQWNISSAVKQGTSVTLCFPADKMEEGGEPDGE